MVSTIMCSEKLSVKNLASDSTALVILYNSTSGKSWMNKTNWLY